MVLPAIGAFRESPQLGPGRGGPAGLLSGVLTWPVRLVVTLIQTGLDAAKRGRAPAVQPSCMEVT